MKASYSQSPVCHQVCDASEAECCSTGTASPAYDLGVGLAISMKPRGKGQLDLTGRLGFLTLLEVWSVVCEHSDI